MSFVAVFTHPAGSSRCDRDGTSWFVFPTGTFGLGNATVTCDGGVPATLSLDRNRIGTGEAIGGEATVDGVALQFRGSCLFMPTSDVPAATFTWRRTCRMSFNST